MTMLIEFNADYIKEWMNAHSLCLYIQPQQLNDISLIVRNLYNVNSYSWEWISVHTFPRAGSEKGILQ